MKKKTLAFILTLCVTVTGVVCFAAWSAARWPRRSRPHCSRSASSLSGSRMLGWTAPVLTSSTLIWTRSNNQPARRSRYGKMGLAGGWLGSFFIFLGRKLGKIRIIVF